MSFGRFSLARAYIYALCISDVVNAQGFEWRYFMRYIYKFSFIHPSINLLINSFIHSFIHSVKQYSHGAISVKRCEKRSLVMQSGAVTCKGEESWVYGANCTYTCNDGFVLLGGKSFITCQRKEKWDSPVPFCEG